MFCIHCGTPVTASNKFCGACGMGTGFVPPVSPDARPAAEPLAASSPLPTQPGTPPAHQPLPAEQLVEYRPQPIMRLPFKLLLIFVILPLLAVGCVAALSGSPSDDADFPPTPEGQLAAAVQDRIGSSNRGVDQRVSVSWNTGSAGERELVVTWAINDNLTDGLTKDGLRLDARNILEVVRSSGPSSDRVVLDGTASMVDQLGNVSEQRVVLATYERTVIDTINFDAAPIESVLELSVVEWLFIHPEFEY